MSTTTPISRPEENAELRHDGNKTLKDTPPFGGSSD